MCEHSTVNAAAALREIRRRKILENSVNRLKQIENINSSSAKHSTQISWNAKSEPKVKNINLINNEIPSPDIESKLSDLLKTSEELNKSDFLLNDKNNAEEDEIEELQIISDDYRDSREQNVIFKSSVQKRLHYVLLAIAVNILLYFNAGFLFFENILCPFYSLKTIELLSIRDKKENFQPVMFLFIAALPNSVQKFTKITLNLFLTLLSDLCIYLFIFIIGAKIINSGQL